MQSEMKVSKKSICWFKKHEIVTVGLKNCYRHKLNKAKAVTLHAMKALGGTGV
jgi:hypothetical protein